MSLLFFILFFFTFLEHSLVHRLTRRFNQVVDGETVLPPKSGDEITISSSKENLSKKVDYRIDPTGGRKLVHSISDSRYSNTTTNSTIYSSPSNNTTESPKTRSNQQTSTTTTSFSPETYRTYSPRSQSSMSPGVEMRRLSDEVIIAPGSNSPGGGENAPASSRSFWSSCVSICRSPFSLKRANERRASMSVPRNRMVLVTGRHRFVDNVITTAKYNFFTFLPKFLFEQFRKYSNIFFLFIALMQQIPNVSPTGRFTTAVPLAFILLVSASKEIFEDVKRHTADKLVNSTEVYVFNRFGKNFLKKKWKNVSVGDIVLIDQDNFFPSDLVLLSSHEPNGKLIILIAKLSTYVCFFRPLLH